MKNWIKCHILRVHGYNLKKLPNKKWIITKCIFCGYPKWVYYNRDISIARYYRGNPLKGGQSPYDEQIENGDPIL